MIIVLAKSSNRGKLFAADNSIGSNALLMLQFTGAQFDKFSNLEAQKVIVQHFPIERFMIHLRKVSQQFSREQFFTFPLHCAMSMNYAFRYVHKQEPNKSRPLGMIIVQNTMSLFLVKLEDEASLVEFYCDL